LFALAVLFPLPLAAGCGRPASQPAPTTTRARRVDPATAGTIRGRVVFEGAAPRNPAVTMTSDRFCADANPGQPVDDAVIVGPDGSLQNVFVYVKDDLRDYAFDPPAHPARLEQKGCRFAPRVVGICVGQPLVLANQDDTLHNIHAVTRTNDEFNLGAVEHQSFTRTFTAPEVMVTFKCDVHNWMRAYAGVVGHPYFAVTGADGRFSMEGLPPGEYVVEAWHEKFGTRSVRVKVAPKEIREIGFAFE
jgi:plastocyanin